jgi:hypothetical protein
MTTTAKAGPQHGANIRRRESKPCLAPSSAPLLLFLIKRKKKKKKEMMRKKPKYIHRDDCYIVL